MYGNYIVRFKDGTHVPKENQVTYLAGIITKEAKGHAEVEQRIAAIMATWKKMHNFVLQRCQMPNTVETHCI